MSECTYEVYDFPEEDAEEAARRSVPIPIYDDSTGSLPMLPWQDADSLPCEMYRGAKQTTRTSYKRKNERVWESEPTFTKRKRPEKPSVTKARESAKAKTKAKNAKAVKTRVKEGDGEGSLRITDSFGKIRSTAAWEETKLDASRLHLTKMLSRTRVFLWRYLKEICHIDPDKTHPSTLQMSLKEEKKWLDDQKFTTKDYIMETPLNNIPLNTFHSELERSLSILRCTANQARHVPCYSIPQKCLQIVVERCYHLMEIKTCKPKELEMKSWPEFKFSLHVEYHDTHSINRKSCGRATFFLFSSALIVDFCRREFFFLPPLEFGERSFVKDLLEYILRGELSIPPEDYQLAPGLVELLTCKTNTDYTSHVNLCCGSSKALSSANSFESVFPSQR